jgi:hypothetical protein
MNPPSGKKNPSIKKSKLWKLKKIDKIYLTNVHRRSGSMDLCQGYSPGSIVSKGKIMRAFSQRSSINNYLPQVTVGIRLSSEDYKHGRSG